MEDEKPDNVIEFPTKSRVKEKMTKLVLDKDAVHSMVLSLATINATTDVADACKQRILKLGLPCGSACICHVHMLSAMALEIIFDGDKAEEASSAIVAEYAIVQKGLKEDQDG